MPITLSPAISPTTTTTGTPGSWRVATAANYRPVTALLIRRHLRDPSTNALTDEDAEELIDAATAHAEECMSICLAARTIAATYDSGQPLVLPRGPIISIVSVTTASGVAATAFTLKHEGNRATLLPTPTLSGPITIMYRAGYANPDGTETPEAIPADIRHAIKMHVGTLYEARESTTDKPRDAVPHTLDAFYRRRSRALGVG